MRLLSDPEFVKLYGDVVQALDEYRSRPRWYAKQGMDMPGPVAYFSMEFGIHESLGIYSGGLGVLAGDHCKAASDLGRAARGGGAALPLRLLPPDGGRRRLPAAHLPRLRLRPAPRPPGAGPGGGAILTVPIDLPGRVVHAAVWKVQVGLVPVLMLDTDIPLNDPADRPITGTLYVRGREMRLCQEIVHGIGGVRALRALGIHPAVWHMNEGHVAFLALERARERVQMGDSLAEALAAVKRTTVFTTHTPVPAGNETFDRKLVRKYLEPWIRDVGCEPDEALALGADNGNFNMTAFSIRLAAGTNGVSRLHGEVSSAMWRHLFPDGAAEPVGYVTNGVHTASWVGPEMRTFYTQHVDPAWEQKLLEPEAWQKVREAPDAALWSAHRAQKERLIRFVRERVRVQSARHGLSPDELRQVEALLDPHALTIGFARRFATYKRAFLIMSDLDRLRAIVSDPARPVQFLFAGKAHPADREGQEVVRRLFSLTHGEFRGQARLPRGLRHRGRPRPRAGLRRVAQHPAPAAGGERHLGHEGAGQRRGQPQHPRRLVGGGLPRRQRLGHRRRQHQPGHRRPGPGRRASRSTALSRPRWCRASSRGTRPACRATGSAP